MNSYLTALVLVLATTILAIGGLLLTRKLLTVEKLRSLHEVGGVLLSVVGTLYAVLLGLIVVDAMQQFQNARVVSEHEANNVAEVFILAKKLPEPMRTKVRDMCIQYADSVLNVEWQLLGEGEQCPIARATAVDLLETLMDFEPTTENEKSLYPIMVQEASEFWQNRQARVSLATKGIPPIEWVVLLAGAAITIFFSFLFGIEDLKLQSIMTAMVAMLISLNLTLLLLFAHPFGGDLSVQKDGFQTAQSIFAGTPKP